MLAQYLKAILPLSQLDPANTYPSRATKLIAKLVGSPTTQLVYTQRGKKVVEFDVPVPPASEVPVLVPPALPANFIELPLKVKGKPLGHVRFYFDPPVKADKQLLTLLVQILANGVFYSDRMLLTKPSSKRDDFMSEVRDRLDLTSITPREKQVVALLASGLSTPLIGKELKLTTSTVHTYLKRIYAKMGVHSRIELVAKVTGTLQEVKEEIEETKIETPDPNFIDLEAARKELGEESIATLQDLQLTELIRNLE